MKDDPYSTLAGLDSRLFQEEKSSKTTKQRDNAATKTPSDDATDGETSATANARPVEPSQKRKNDRRRQRLSESTRTRVSSPAGHQDEPRIRERHTHDVYRDQVRWINRVKLDIEETYGTRITSNQLVQLAIDVVRDDYEHQADKSLLIRSLVNGERLADLKISTSIDEEET